MGTISQRVIGERLSKEGTNNEKASKMSGGKLLFGNDAPFIPVCQWVTRKCQDMKSERKAVSGLDSLYFILKQMSYLTAYSQSWMFALLLILLDFKRN